MKSPGLGSPARRGRAMSPLQTLASVYHRQTKQARVPTASYWVVNFDLDARIRLCNIIGGTAC